MMWGWLPIVGPIIDGIVAIVKGQQNVQVQTMAQSNTMLSLFVNDIGVRLCRDLIMFPVAVWTAGISWDTLIAENHREWMIHIAQYPATLAFLPYAVLTFLFGYAVIKR